MTIPRGTFKAFRISDSGGTVSGAIVDTTLDELTPGEVVIAAAYSSVNYKDALAATGGAKIIKRFPLIGGIDVAGVVAASTDARFSEGDPVVVDLSLSGSAVGIEVKPALGVQVTLGTMRGQVVRHFDDGVAIEFAVVQRPETLDAEFNAAGN